ncbi:MAG: TRAP transporter small permease [Alphaproteobacteria bacterium]|nr:TRAP transporter small permease [Alphaproteobacteria bacterium]
MTHPETPPATGLLRGWQIALNALAVVVGLLLVFAMLAVTGDVVARYFFSLPIGWTLEVTEHILLYTPFLGMAWLVNRADGHVRIDVVLVHLQPRTVHLVDGVVAFVVALMCAIAGWYASATTLDHMLRQVETYGIYPIPKWLLIVAIAVGFSLTAVEFFRKGLIHLRARRAMAG